MKREETEEILRRLAPGSPPPTHAGIASSLDVTQLNVPTSVGQPLPTNNTVLKFVLTPHVSRVNTPPSDAPAPTSMPQNCRRVVGTVSLPVPVVQSAVPPGHAKFAGSADVLPPDTVPLRPYSHPASGTAFAHHGELDAVGVCDEVRVAVMVPVGLAVCVLVGVDAALGVMEGVTGGVIDGEGVKLGVPDGVAPRVSDDVGVGVAVVVGGAYDHDTAYAPEPTEPAYAPTIAYSHRVTTVTTTRPWRPSGQLR